MMKKQSLDFITGYIFAKMDIRIFKYFGDSIAKKTLTESVTVPKTWFGLSSCSQVTNDIKGDEKYLLRENICEALDSIYPRHKTICERIIADKQYIRFDFRTIPVPEIKKMTVEEIEKELGYKIEIVSGK